MSRIAGKSSTDENANQQFTHQRITLFLPSLRGGGAERAMLLFAGGLSSAGHPVDLVVAKAVGPLAAEIPEGVRVIDLNQDRVSRTLLPLIRYLNEAAPYALYSTIAHANILAILAGKLFRVVTRVVVRESNVPKTALSRSLSAKIVRFLIPRVYPWACAVISVSEGVKQELVEMNPALEPKIFVLPTPVISRRLSELADEPVEHPWLRDNVPFILGAGRLHEQKDFATLIKAFALVHQQRRVRLIILGEGPERSALFNLAQQIGSINDDLLLPGFVANPYPYFKHAQTFVLSSRYEGLPNVLIQAMACGTPVVATDCKSGPRELLRNGALGFLVPVGDVAAMANGISRALESSRRIDAQQYVIDNYGVEVAVRSYLAVAEA